MFGDPRTANVNEYSTRYSVAIDSAHRTTPEKWRLQSQANLQGSSGAVAASVGSSLSAAEVELHEHARAVYEERLNKGVAREQARKDLPLWTYTEEYWKIDLHNYSTARRRKGTKTNVSCPSFVRSVRL